MRGEMTEKDEEKMWVYVVLRGLWRGSLGKWV